MHNDGQNLLSHNRPWIWLGSLALASSAASAVIAYEIRNDYKEKLAQNIISNIQASNQIVAVGGTRIAQISAMDPRIKPVLMPPLTMTKEAFCNNEDVSSFCYPDGKSDIVDAGSFTLVQNVVGGAEKLTMDTDSSLPLEELEKRQQAVQTLKVDILQISDIPEMKLALQQASY